MNMKNINDEKSTFNEKKNKIMGHIGHLAAQYSPKQWRSSNKTYIQ